MTPSVTVIRPVPTARPLLVPADASLRARTIVEVACQLHEEAIAFKSRGHPASRTTAFCLPSSGCIRCVVVSGNPARLPGGGATLKIMELPAPETMWRGRYLAGDDPAACTSIELVSHVAGAPAPVSGSNAGPFSIGRHTAHRAEALLRIGEADRRLAERDGDKDAARTTCHREVDETREVVDPAIVAELFEGLEGRRLEHQGMHAELRYRRMHFFPAAAPSDRVDAVTELYRGGRGPSETVSLRSFLRCSGDGAVHAVCEALYRPIDGPCQPGTGR